MKKVLIILFIAFLGLAGLVIYQRALFYDGKLHIIFCDVGQGDGILIKTPSNHYLLIDAGPSDAILACLSAHMPFWERKISLALLTHPHADHFMGYYYVIDRYIIDHFATEELINTTESFTGLQKLLDQHGLEKQIVVTGDTWLLTDPQGREVVITIAGASREFVLARNPDGIITNSAESASLATLVTYGDFSILLTGDAPLDEMEEIALKPPMGLDILQIPHHGSSTGVSKHILEVLDPRLAVISVGAGNRYGHPKKEVLELLKEEAIETLQTDQRGDIKIISDGASFEIRPPL